MEAKNGHFVNIVQKKEPCANVSHSLNFWELKELETIVFPPSEP